MAQSPLEGPILHFRHLLNDPSFYTDLPEPLTPECFFKCWNGFMVSIENSLRVLE